MSESVRHFTSGATRSADDNKLNPLAAISPEVLERFAEYMQQQKQLPDGSIRPEGDWKAGMPRKRYAEALGRHFLEFWLRWEDAQTYTAPEYLEEPLCALLFNIQGLLHEVLLRRDIKEDQCCREGGKDGIHTTDCSVVLELRKRPIVSEVKFPSQGQDNSPGPDKPDIHGGQVEGPTKVTPVPGYQCPTDPTQAMYYRLMG